MITENATRKSNSFGLKNQSAPGYPDSGLNGIIKIDSLIIVDLHEEQFGNITSVRLNRSQAG